MSDFIEEIVPMIERGLSLSGKSESSYKFFETSNEGFDNADITIFPDDDNPENAIWIAQWIRIEKAEDENAFTNTYFQPGRRGAMEQYKTEEHESYSEAVAAAMAEMLRVELIELL